MPFYRYQAINAIGKTIKNRVEADSLTHAKRLLADADLVVFDISETLVKHQYKRLKLSASQRNLWVRQLATLLGAGYTLEKALQSCGRQSHNENIQVFSQTVHRRVVEGLPFYRVLADYSKIFDETFCATVQAGESSGHLDAVLARLAEHAETATQMRDSIRQALIYPLILVVVATLMITYLMTAVIPDVVKVFSSSGQALPAMTQTLLSMSHFVTQYGLWLLPLVFLSLWQAKRLLARPVWRYRWHGLQLRLPVLGEVSSAYHASNYAATLSILLRSGVKLVAALNISTQTLANTVMRQVAGNACEQVQKGQSLANALKDSRDVFPGMLIELVDSGERTGQLAEMLDKAAIIYRRQSQSRLNTLTALLGPVMILIMGGLIFAIVLAILLPIFDLNQTI